VPRLFRIPGDEGSRKEKKSQAGTPAGVASYIHTGVYSHRPPDRSNDKIELTNRVWLRLSLHIPDSGSISGFVDLHPVALQQSACGPVQVGNGKLIADLCLQETQF